MNSAASEALAVQRSFLAPRVTVIGQGASASVGDTLRDNGVESGQVAVVADAVVSEIGLAAGLLEGLRRAGYRPVPAGDISGEPDDGVVDRAAEIAREAEVRAVVGIGGGSALDVAKLVALLVRNEGRAADWLGGIPPSADVAPLLLVPTTAGTGAEVTRIAMISVAGAKRISNCAGFVPLAAVLDPDLVAGLPPAVLAATGMDALSHAVESLLSRDRSLSSAMHAERAIEMIVRDLPAAVLDGDKAARGNLLYAAHLAGLALNAGVVLGHSLAYVIARRSRLPHGTTCALALPYCLAYDQRIPGDQAEPLARLLTGGSSRDLGEAAHAVDDLARSIGLPRALSEIPIAVTEAAVMAEETVRDYPRPTNPEPLDAGRIARLFEHMHTGDVAGAWAAMGERVDVR